MNIDELITAARPSESPTDTMVAAHRQRLDAAIATEGQAPPRRAGIHARRGTAGVLTLAAAAAAVGVGAFVLDPFETGESSVDALVAEAAEATAAVAHSGRVIETTSDGRGADRSETLFAGDDSASFTQGRPITRWVDGASYLFVDAYCGELEWWADGGSTAPSYPDLGRLVAVLTPSASFELVGEDPVGDVPSIHLRAATPDAIPRDDFGMSRFSTRMAADQISITGVDVWVDDDGIVRRMDLASSVTSGEDVSWYVTSMVFTELGAAIDIEVPDVYRELPRNDAADPCEQPYIEAG